MRPPASRTGSAEDAAAVRERDPAELAARLRLALGRIRRRLSEQAPGDLTLGQLSALAGIEANAPIRLGELARIEGVSAPTLSRAVASLEVLGLVRREPDPADARAQRLALSPEGADRLAAFRSARTSALAGLLGGLDADQLDTLAAAIPVLEALAMSDRPSARPPRPGP